MEAAREIWFRELAVGFTGTKGISSKGVMVYGGATTGKVIKLVLRWESDGVGHVAIGERNLRKPGKLPIQEK
jgi:hypothetical protein